MSFRRCTYRHPIVLFPFLLSLLFTACNTSNQQPVDPEQLLSATEATADAQQLIKLVEETHPYFFQGYFDDLPDGSYEQRKQELLEAAEQQISVKDFYLQAARYISTLHDGHTNLNLPSDAWLRLSWSWREEGLVLLPSDRFPQGGLIQSIGGIEAERIGKLIDELQPYENESGRLRNRSNYANQRYIHIEAGVALADSVQLEILADGELLIIEEPYYTEAAPTTKQKDFEFSLLENDTVALVTTRGCVVGAEATAVAKELKKALASGVTKVIFDLRQNPGGNSSVWDQFYDVMGIQPGQMGSLRRNGSTISHSAARLSSGTRPELDIVVLVAPRTFSSATFLVSTIHDNNFGTMIGREPANTITHPGFPKQFSLDHSHLPLAVSHVYWIRQDPSLDERHDELLDIEVDWDEDALETALNFLRNG